MKERPILFSGEMVRAILDGRKTQTRRIVKIPKAFKWNIHNDDRFPIAMRGTNIKCPFGNVGDRLWVRESWTHHQESLEYAQAKHEDIMGGSAIYYAATDPHPEQMRWKPSIHMPRWASRIQLEITSGRVERLHDISEEDAKAEGTEFWAPPLEGFDPVSPQRVRFQWLWEAINGSESQKSNPWVWVIEFKRINPTPEVARGE